MQVVHKIFSSLTSAGWMFYDTAWALVLGFTLSGVVQAFTSKAAMERVLGDHKLARVGKASILGALSSSCSYAASALAHSIFKKGADFTTAIIFMFASTNLVIELGAVLWLLMGWQFALAEFIGGAVMILLLTIILPRVVNANEVAKLRKGDSAFLSDSTMLAINGAAGLSLLNTDGGQSMEEPMPTNKMGNQKFVTRLRGAAGYTIGDFLMLRYELIIGFIVAGFAATLVPNSFWSSLFMTNLHGSHNAGIFSSQHLLSILAVLVNAVMGPVLAFISFVCSVGNVPLAAALWSSGASFGGVIAFIFADLVSFPLVAIYFKYYGKRVSVKLVLTFWAVMSLSGVITQAIFAALKLLPAKRTLMAMSSSHFGANATTYLNFLALIIFIVVLVLYRQGLAAAKNSTEGEFAQDPICLMQVRKANAPASAHVDGVDYYFCMEGCKTKFLSNVAAGK